MQLPLSHTPRSGETHPLRRMIEPALAAWMLMLLLTAGAANAVTPVVFVWPDLSEQRVRLSALGNGEVAYFDADGQRVTRPTRELVAILWTAERDATAIEAENVQPSALMSFFFPGNRGNAEGQAGDGGEPESPEAPGATGPDVAELVDGQKWVGRWTGVREGGLVFRSQSLEIERVFAIERVLRIGPQRAGGEGESEPVSEQIGQDVVTLTNGDRLAGFIAGVTDTAVELIPEGEGQPIPLPRDRVAALRLANPPEPPGAAMHTLHLHDGSEVLVSEPGTAGDVLAFTLPGEDADAIRVPLTRVHRLDFTGHGRRLLPLTAAEGETLGGGSYFGVPAPPQSAGGDLLLHAPITLSYRVDPLARRFATRAVLDLPAGLSDARRRLAGLRLGLTVNGGETRWWTLDADRPAISINQPLPAANAGRASIEIELDPHINGPVLDRLRLEDPRILRVHPDTAEPADAGPK